MCLHKRLHLWRPVEHVHPLRPSLTTTSARNRV
jgi:hypothetical protein